MNRFLTPNNFTKVSAIALPVCSVLAIGFTIAGLYFALFISPVDYQQGETVRIMYVHVPAAWMSLFVYSVIFFSSISLLVWRNPLSDLISEASVKIGAAFTLITLITGSLWGKPMWGTWWVWDARLTSVLVLFFLYIGLMVLRNSYENSDRGQKATAILGIIGFINIPIIKFSVDWWNTLHQPASIVKMGGPSIHHSMLAPLFLMFFTFLCYYLVVLMVMVKTGIIEKKLLRGQLKKKT